MIVADRSSLDVARSISAILRPSARKVLTRDIRCSYGAFSLSICLRLHAFLIASKEVVQLLNLHNCMSVRRVADRDPALRQSISPSAFSACNSSESTEQQQCEVGEQGWNCEKAAEPSARRSEWVETLSEALHAAVDDMLVKHQPPQGHPVTSFVDEVTRAMDRELRQWRSAVRATALGTAE